MPVKQDGLVRKRGRRPEDVPPEEAAELKRRYEAGEGMLALEEGFDGSFRTLRAVLQREGVKFRPSHPVTPMAPPAMRNAYAAGVSIAALAERYEVSTDKVRRMLLKAGVTLRPRGRPSRQKQ